MIKVSNLAKKFGSNWAVKNLSLEVAEGEIFGLVGPDGAGKTTAIRMLLGLMDQTEGEITLFGEKNLEKMKDQIGYVPQRFSLSGDLTVMENILVIGWLYGISRKKMKERAEEILDFTKLLAFKDRLADNLSGGMKQKLALAAGLIHRPKILFLDEPTTGVDPVSRREFWQMLYNLNQEGMSIFLSTPYMDEAELCGRVAFMHQGEIVSCAPPAILRQRYPYGLLELHAPDKRVKSKLADCPIREINAFGDRYHLVVDNPKEVSETVKKALDEAGIAILSLQEIPPTLEDVFVALAGEGS